MEEKFWMDFCFLVTNVESISKSFVKNLNDRKKKDLKYLKNRKCEFFSFTFSKL